MKLKLMYSLIIFYVFVITLIISCADTNNFKYKGEYPQETYIGLNNIEGVVYITDLDTNLVSYRNRIYVTIDSSSNTLLNGHVISIHDFERYFKFVYTNPKKLKHLPESTENVVIFFAINHASSKLIEGSNLSLGINERQLKVNEMRTKMNRIVQALQAEYVTKELGIALKDATVSQQALVKKKYPSNIVEAISLEQSIKIRDKEIAFKKTLHDNKKRSLKKRNVIGVVCTKENEVYLREKLFRVEDLTDTIKIMLINDLNNPKYPEKITRAIVSLKNKRGTNYDFYKKVYDAIKKAYEELWEEKSQDSFGKPFNALTKKEQRQIKNEIPMNLSEAEPTNIGERKKYK